LGWRSVFVFLGGFGVVMLLICYRLLPETLPPARRAPFALAPIAGNYLRCVRHPQFVLMSLSIAFIFAGVALYIGSAAAFVMGILHQPETAFAWLFIPMIGGMVLGSGAASRLGAKAQPAKLITAGFAIMAAAVALSVGYTAYFAVQVPYAVMPIFIYTFGLALAMPGMSVRTLSLFPEMSGLAASMQGFIQMFLFALVSGLISPLLFDSAHKLALGHAAGVLIGVALWALATRVKLVVKSDN
jgi:DHA1 family bicyclomycin/chloramphenicol resistance-like MFS transporter